jgi:hypothetical protein
MQEFINYILLHHPTTKIKAEHPDYFCVWQCLPTLMEKMQNVN